VGDELQAIVTGLRHARHALGRGSLVETADLWPRLERSARLVAGLDRSQRSAIRPLLLAVLDELGRTVSAFGREQSQLRDRLKAASRSLAADAAYRRAGRS
jgi:hypothetical protein